MEDQKIRTIDDSIKVVKDSWSKDIAEIRSLLHELVENLATIKPTPVEFRRFCGEDPELWISQAERYFKFHGTLENNMLLRASLYLDGEALEWFRWLFRNKQLSDWEHFVAKVRIRFGKQHLESPEGHEATIREYSTDIEDKLVPCEIAQFPFTEILCVESKKLLAAPALASEMQPNLDDRKSEEFQVFYEMSNSRCPTVFAKAQSDAPVEMIAEEATCLESSKAQLFAESTQRDMPVKYVTAPSLDHVQWKIEVETFEDMYLAKFLMEPVIIEDLCLDKLFMENEDVIPRSDIFSDEMLSDDDHEESTELSSTFMALTSSTEKEKAHTLFEDLRKRGCLFAKLYDWQPVGGVAMDMLGRSSQLVHAGNYIYDAVEFMDMDLLDIGLNMKPFRGLAKLGFQTVIYFLQRYSSSIADLVVYLKFANLLFDPSIHNIVITYAINGNMFAHSVVFSTYDPIATLWGDWVYSEGKSASRVVFILAICKDAGLCGQVSARQRFDLYPYDPGIQVLLPNAYGLVCRKGVVANVLLGGGCTYYSVELLPRPKLLSATAADIVEAPEDAGWITLDHRYMDKGVQHSFNYFIPNVRWRNLFSMAIISVRKQTFRGMPCPMLTLGMGKGVVHFEIRLVCVALSCAFICTDAGVISQYVKLIADALLGSLRYDIRYKVEDPFDWTKLISLQDDNLGTNSHISGWLSLTADGYSHYHIIASHTRCKEIALNCLFAFDSVKRILLQFLLYSNLADKVLFEAGGIVVNSVSDSVEDIFGNLENYVWDPF
ncbi:hypothetical protein A4A49_16541 [Nicotiana attenuata]|uniref:Retrotransposon gag domain-containing protein n=1 Tax=Nicotiana attenuata TaxID=49451 RepID=A0A314KM40_NICAT|nr:hypothetical protein A4A49_16541 [Nicotiana attenuata]